MPEKTGKEFMKKTQYQFLGQSDQMKGLPQPPLELDYDRSKPHIDLPKPESLKFKDISLRKAIEGRRSIRSYSDQPLTLAELSWLLWCTQGVKEVINRPVTLRNVPSAGARHAFETYLLINRVEGLQPGLYRFLAINHKLVEVNLEAGLADKITEAGLKQSMIRRSAVTFIWVAIVYRMKWRYQERGYRYLHIDVGHVCQNLYLAGESINCGVCAIGAFEDEVMNKLLGLDGVEEFVIYLAPVGKKKTSES
ncbi:MAG: SagB/ThcOx family dehydrogenase [Candidatus Hodarchaeota archaeon]